MDLQELRRECMDWIGVVEVKYRWPAFWIR